MAIAYTQFSIGALYFERGEYIESLNQGRHALELMQHIGARGYYGYVLSYLACTYALMGKPASAIRAAWYHLRNIRAIGSDVENGRTFLGVALALKNNGNLSEKAQTRLNEISQYNQVNPDAESFFKLAIERASKADYVNTLVPALFNYGKFLMSETQSEQALEHLKAAQQAAEKAGMLKTHGQIKDFMKQLT